MLRKAVSELLLSEGERAAHTCHCDAVDVVTTVIEIVEKLYLVEQMLLCDRQPQDGTMDL